ncbi:MAG: transcriptional regulator [Chloroflexi bacterium]|nr:MAG: transcriptional regulator [Chloroflexota bacterium]MBL1192856.1 transcriptional regulator [Chloroflexota bacterium]NOH10149.1 helix-turn-helix transcriptional regulator [Chloroflexota bacterium]
MDEIVIENHVKLARVEQGLTQNELAVAIGVTRQTIGLIEAGKYNPSLKICLLIAQTTHKTLDQLFWIKGTEDESLNR